jgi:hypothetical protein
MTDKIHSTSNGQSKAPNNIETCGGENLLDAGLRYIKRGWPIFAVDANKKPLTDFFPHGFKNATTDEQTIRAVAFKYPAASWALAVEGDLLVGDLDVKHGENGIRDFERLHGCHPKDFAAPKVRTASGGYHIYLNTNGSVYQNTVGQIALGIDTRASGVGYAVLPSGGNGYFWETSPDTPRPHAPAWMDAALRKEFHGSTAQPKAFQGQTPFGAEALSRAVNRIINAPDGQQEHILSVETLKLGHYIAGGVLEHGPTEAALIAAGLQMVNYDQRRKWTRAEITKKVREKLARGFEDPWDDGTAIEQAMAEAHAYWRTPEGDELMMQYLRGLAADPEPPQHEAKGEQPEPAHPWLNSGEQSRIRRAGQGVPVPVPFMVEGLFHEVGTSLIAGKYFSGKTFVAMSLAASVATGQPFAGREVRRKGAVLWLAAEGEREVDKRIRAAVVALGYDPDIVPFYTQTGGVPKILANPKGIGEIINQAKRAAKVEYDLPLALIVFDTAIKSAGYKKSENDSVEVNNMIHTIEDYVHAYKCHAMFIDHMGKNEELGARGSSDKPSSVDTYGEITNGKKARKFYIEKVKGDKGDMSVTFDIVGVKQDGQNTAVVKWGDRDEPVTGAAHDLEGDDKLLYACVVETNRDKGVELKLFHSDIFPRRCVRKAEIRDEFHKRRNKGHEADRVAFGRAWGYLLGRTLFSTKADGKDQWEWFVFLE